MVTNRRFIGVAVARNNTMVGGEGEMQSARKANTADIDCSPGMQPQAVPPVPTTQMLRKTKKINKIRLQGDYLILLQ